jgi:hypothetical protein
MAQNVGTLVSSAIRPNDSLDPIASAFAVEIKGGLHTTSTATDRNNIIFQRREWGMMCYVTTENKTYQLTYGYAPGASGTDIMNNSNWKEFSGAGGSGGGGSEWIDSVISIQNAEPISPNDGDRYIVGQSPTGGVDWTSLTSDSVVQWNSTLSVWIVTTPTDGMSVRVDNLDNTIYKYEGVFPLGTWQTEKLNSVRNVSFTTSSGLTYSAISNPVFDSYSGDIIFLSTFASTNSATAVSLDVNGLGLVSLLKASESGLIPLKIGDLIPGVMYSILYNGTNFQISNPSNESLFNVKRYVEPTDSITVPQYYQYWVYGDLEVAGNLINYGHVIIANGGLILSGGTVTNMPGSEFAIISLQSGGATTSYNNSPTINFDIQNTIFGPSVSAYVKDGSLTASKLDTGSNGGATAGYILSVDSSGDFVWTNVSLSGLDFITGVTAGPGLTGGGTAGFISLEIDSNIAGNGLDYSSGVLTVNTSEITNSLAGDGLIANGSTLDIQVDTTGLTVSGDTVRLQSTITGDRTFQDSVIVNGNFTVNGTTSYVYTENLIVEDNIIMLNGTFSGIPYLNSGIEVNRGSELNSSLIWNEGLEMWTAGLSGSEAPILLNSGIGLTTSGFTISLTDTGATAGSYGNSFSYPVFTIDAQGRVTDIATQSIDLSSGGTTLAIGPAEDGTYTDGIFTDFTPSTPIGTAVDRFNEMLLLLAPTPPSNWNNAITSISFTSPSWTARTLTSASNVTIYTDTTPDLTNVDSVGTLSNAKVDTTGLTFSLYDNGLLIGTAALSGTYTVAKNTGYIQHSASTDPYTGVAGQAGFWKGITNFLLTGSLPTISASSSQRTLQLFHPGTDSPETFNYYIDSPLSVTIGTITATVPSMTSYISGVPTLTTSQTVTNISFPINNVASYFYAASSVYSINAGHISGSTGDPDSTPTYYGETGNVTGKSGTIQINQFSDLSFFFTVKGRNSIGTYGSDTTFTSTSHRIDTVSNESSRKTSGSGSYPASGYNGVYDTTQSLVGSYTSELQLRNGLYVYPTVNYTSVGGPNYSGASGTRWATFNLGTFTSNSAFTLNISGSSGITTIGQANLLIEIKIEGATSWVDGDSSYSGVGNPGSGADGVAAVVIGSSTATSRRITFGSITYSGAIIVRIGFTGTGLQFSSLSASSIV